jgi:hypothetical protein
MLSSHSHTRKLKRIYDQACKTQTGPQVWERRNEVSPTQASQILTLEAIVVVAGLQSTMVCYDICHKSNAAQFTNKLGKPCCKDRIKTLSNVKATSQNLICIPQIYMSDPCYM